MHHRGKNTPGDGHPRTRKTLDLPDDRGDVFIFSCVFKIVRKKGARRKVIFAYSGFCQLRLLFVDVLRGAVRVGVHYCML